MAYPTAIGCGCLLGAGVSQPHAAEWSMQPTFSWTADYDSDRNLAVNSQGSEAAVLYGDLRLQRALENTQIVLEPKFALRRYSDSIWGPGDDRSLYTSFNWMGEHARLDLSGSLANQSTLTTELLETGIVSTNTRRRLAEAGGEWDWTLAERHQLFLQLSYTGVGYQGPPLVELELPGYRYPSGSVGGRFNLSERTTISVSAFGDALLSDRAGASSHEAGAQVELRYAHSERTSFDVSIGESRRSVAGVSGLGTVAALSVSRNLSLGTATLGYTRNLVPYGIGFLVERQQFTAAATRPLTPYLVADITVLRIQNNQSTVLLGLDRRSYDNAVLGLNWQLNESWTLRSEATTSWSQPIRSNVTVHEWRTALTMTWKPSASARSR
jgi:hypothetical protein